MVMRPLHPPGRHLQPPADRNGRSRHTFRYMDYQRDGAARYQTTTLEPAEFIRRFLLNVLPKGFHRIRHCGLFASAVHRDNIARIRQLLAVPHPAIPDGVETEAAPEPWRCCPRCGGPIIIIEILMRTSQPRAPPTASFPSGRASP